MELQIGKRFKQYEEAHKTQLPNRLPVIIRVDGRAFHTLTKRTKGIQRPFCQNFHRTMIAVTRKLCKETHAIIGYTQSDEISLLLLNDQKHETQPWFDNEVNKIVSLTASIASVHFSQYLGQQLNTSITAHFDSRTFVVPPNDIKNYFIWRQLDAIRNAKNGWSEHALGEKIGKGTARKELQGKAASEQVKYVEEITGHKFSDVDPGFIYGAQVIIVGRNEIIETAPYYIEDKNAIENAIENYYKKDVQTE